VKFFSVDDHIIEPADVWSSRVPDRYREAAPRVVEEEGREYWVYEDRRASTMGLNAVAKKPREEWDMDPVRFSDMAPGCYDPKARLHDLIAERVVSSISFPTLPRFGGALFPSFTDKDLADVCVKAWNDYMFDEWCAAAPSFYVPMPIVQLWDIGAATAELERSLGRGARALCLPEETSCLGLQSYWDPIWDPIWARCQEADLPVCMHIGSSGWQPYVPPEAPASIRIALGFVPTITHAVGMMFSPVCRKFPDLKIVYSEGGVGWVPNAMERADRKYELHKAWGSVGGELMPSDIAKRNMYFCTFEEVYGLEQRHLVGVDHIMWEGDYPHANTSWPGALKETEAIFANVPADDAELIFFRNAERIFHWTCPEVEDIEGLI
jgi:predicted TIM-barrel fold metal-dependent hydrolase